jgi:hypothetical protein
MSTSKKEVGKRAEIICCCEEADNNCYLLCPKGKRLNPDKVYKIARWKKST